MHAPKSKHVQKQRAETLLRQWKAFSTRLKFTIKNDNIKSWLETNLNTVYVIIEQILLKKTLKNKLTKTIFWF